MLTEFQAALARFLQGQLDYPGLEEALDKALGQDPGSADAIAQMLDQLFRSSRLPAREYISLKQRLSEMPSGASMPDQPEPPAPPPAPPTPAEPPTPTEPPPQDEAVQGHSDILDILQAPSDEPPDQLQPGQPLTPPPQQEPTSPPTRQESVPSEPPPEEAEPSEDKTVFRQSAPPASPGAQGSEPGTGTGAGYQTGQTGAATGPTGMSQPATGPTGASIPTGTGSNWTDPSKWGEGPAPTMQPGSILKERYVLETVIGRGGMGVVFKARDMRREEAQDRNPHIAVKILNDEFRRHPESLKALQRESRKAQDLAHPNIVTVFDFDRDGQIVYMTMEFLEGQSLDRVTKDATFDGMPLKEAYPLIEGLGNALSYAHRKGVVHSDFKPANTFLTKEGVIKVFDFGIARAAKLPGQKSGDMTLFDPGSLGALTPAYASCEMIEGQEPDPRDDIYALACLAYELLSGRHPFDKRPATEARDKGLVIKPIKGLSRRNWRGLQRGLAFRREDRSPNVEHFLEDLKVRKLNKTMVGLGSAAALVAIAIVAIQGPAYLEQRRIDNLVAEIIAGADAEIPAALQKLNEYEPESQDSVTGDPQVRTRLIDYYDDQIKLAQEALDYPHAESVLAEALALYGDSLTLGRAAEQLARDKADLLAELNDRYNTNLEAGNIMPSDGEDITKVLDVYERIDPSHPALTDPQLAIAYADLAEQLLQSDLPRAALVIETAQQRFPNDARLVGLRDRVTTLREVQDIELRVGELEQELSAALSEIDELQDFGAYESAIQQLEALDPENSVGNAAAQRLQGLVDAAIESSLAQNNWLEARNTLDRYAGLLSPDYATAVRSRVDAAASEYENRVGGVYAGVVDAAQRGDLEAAARGLEQLEQLNSAPGTIRQAREVVTRGYLTAAQRERGAGRFDAAKELIGGGQAVDPAYAGWQAELDAIAQAEQLEGQVMAEQERARLQAERQAKVDALQGRIQSSLDQTPFGIQSARDTVEAVDELARLEPANPLALQGRTEVAARLATTARGLAARDQQFDEGLDLLEQGLELLPAEQELRRAQSEIQAERRDYLAGVAAAQAEELRSELERLLNAPAYDSAWEADLRRVIQGLEPLASNADYVSAKREEVAALYVGRARSLRAEERFDLADRMLTASEWFVSGFESAAQERQLLTDARRAFEQANRERQRQAQVDGLKRTFATELNAERFPDARRALTSLRELLPGNDPFVTEEAPQAIADTYARMAQRAFRENRFDTADQLAREGLKEVSNHPALTQLLAQISPKRLEINRNALAEVIRSSAPTDSARARNTLDKIRADAGSDFSGIEAELIALANQRVAESKSDRDAVVAWLQGIFADYVPPPLAGPPCTANLAGYGSRGRGQCYDYLPGSSEEGPRLIVIPPGSGVAKPFAIGREEVSVSQWNAYCRLSGNCSPRAGQNEQYPITNISVDDARAFASWLSNGTNHVYRLPTDLEWEHAAKATGSASISPNCINQQAGLLGDTLLEVNRGGQNAWGMMNYVGNAQEWVLGSSGGYEARGGSYKDRLGTCDIELSNSHSGRADEITGFRLVRELGEGA